MGISRTFFLFLSQKIVFFKKNTVAETQAIPCSWVKASGPTNTEGPTQQKWSKNSINSIFFRKIKRKQTNHEGLPARKRTPKIGKLYVFSEKQCSKSMNFHFFSDLPYNDIQKTYSLRHFFQNPRNKHKILWILSFFHVHSPTYATNELSKNGVISDPFFQNFQHFWRFCVNPGEKLTFHEGA